MSGDRVAADSRAAIIARTDSVVVVPFFDKGLTPTEAMDPSVEGLKIGSIYMPSTEENGESQQGLVVASSVPDLFVGQHIFYHPFMGQLFRWKGEQYLAIRSEHVVAIRDGLVLRARGTGLVLDPEWSEDLYQAGGLFVVANLFQTPPQRIGRVLSCGPDVLELKVGDRVVMPDTGDEIAWIDTVYYIIPEDEILARLSPS